MAYQVIARKWRPQSFLDLVGQDHISTTLLNALRGQRLPQALLFTGVRGTGKTSSARILAKSLRCSNTQDFVPCGVCRDCEDIADSRSLDVIEIDGASNNGVDSIRELRETVGYMPSTGRFKIYIIDEVHMLSTSAFNALLKTLEEPPAHVIFVMATTEAQKIPNTILSRCQRFDFRRIPSRQIATQLTKICTAEGVKTAPEAVWLIARQADGSMRDSQSLLDQVITFSNGEVTLAKAIEVLGLTDRTLLLEAVTALAQRDTQKTVDVIEKVFKAGYDAKVFAQDLLEELRNTLLVRLCPEDPTRIVDLPDVEIQSLRDLTEALSNEDIHLLFDMCLKGVNDILRSQDSRIVLEMLLLRMAAAPRVANLVALATGASLPSPSPVASPATAPQPKSLAPTTAPTPTPTPTPTMAPNLASTTIANLATNSPAASTTPLAVAGAPAAAAGSGAGSAAGSATGSATGDASDPATGKQKYSISSFVRPAGTPPGTPMPSGWNASTGPSNSPNDGSPANGSSTSRKAAGASTDPTSKNPSAAHTASRSSSAGYHGEKNGEKYGEQYGEQYGDQSLDDTDNSRTVDPNRAKDPWFQFVESVKKSNSLLGAMLENTHLAAHDGNKITIGVPLKMRFMFDKVKEPENIKRIETFLATFWNKTYSVEIKLGDEKIEKVTPKAMAEEQKMAKQRSVELAVEQNPLVQTTQNVFKTQIKSIKDAEKKGDIK